MDAPIVKLSNLFKSNRLSLTCLTLCFFAHSIPVLAQQEILEGRLDAVFGDPRPGSGETGRQLLFLTEDNGGMTELTVSPELLHRNGDFFAWNGKRVRVHLRSKANELALPAMRPESRQVAALTLLELDPAQQALGAPAASGLAGTFPWVSILCKFSDVSAEPRDLAYFQGMYANTPGGTDHFWREVSYDQVNVAGSIAIDWVTLPKTRTDYIPENDDADLNQLFTDCTAAADPFVNFAENGGYSGINMMFNANLDCCAWGGSRYTTLDGLSKVWRVTWEPPWGYAKVAVIAHEMGHGFGLPHSNNFDEDTSPYDSPWDVMSSTSGYAVSDPVYTIRGKHVNAYAKYRLQWISGARLLEVGPDTVVTATIDALATPSTANYRMARIPVSDSDEYYTVEVRKRFGDYDGALPSDVVIIHYVVPGRSEPSWALDIDQPPANYGDNEGTMFRVGERFNDEANEISIGIDAETTNGFVITLATTLDPTDPLIFKNGFE